MERNGQNSSLKCIESGKLKSLAITILDDLYTKIIETNQTYVNEYKKAIETMGDPYNYFFSQQKVYSERLRYAQFLRKNCAFYERVIRTLEMELKRHG